MSSSFFSEEFLFRLERLAMIVRRAVAGQTQGERRSSRRGHSVEFSDFRPYVAGDDFRRIDWNAYARLERFFIKLFVEEEDTNVHLLIDASRSMRWGSPDKLDFALHAAGALGYIALCGLDRVTVTAYDEAARLSSDTYFPPHRGKRQALALFDFLQNLAANPSKQTGCLDPARKLGQFAAETHSKGLLLIFSDLLEDGWMEGLGVLAGRGFEISLIQTLSPDEVNPNVEGDVKLLDVENENMLEVTVDYDVISRYRQNLLQWQAKLHDFCMRRSINYIPLETSLPLEHLLFTWMQRYGVVK